MQYRIVSVSAPLALLATVGFARPSTLQGQARSASRPVSVATQMRILAADRAVRWAAAAPVVHCSPAPLTERPQASGEFARPRVVPLEEAFLDATMVKRTPWTSQTSPR
jgi:hypothetical protein